MHNVSGGACRNHNAYGRQLYLKHCKDEIPHGFDLLPVVSSVVGYAQAIMSIVWWTLCLLPAITRIPFLKPSSVHKAWHGLCVLRVRIAQFYLKHTLRRSVLRGAVLGSYQTFTRLQDSVLFDKGFLKKP